MDKKKKQTTDQVDWKLKVKLKYYGVFSQLVRNFFPQHFQSENVSSLEQNNLCGNMSIMTK